MTTSRHRRPASAHPPRQRHRPGRGLSIVELMVGITISLFILAGATMLLTSQLGDNRRLLLEAQVQQDLRAAADLIARDVRRAGYWGQAYRQVWPANGAAVVNPYATMTPAAAPAGTGSVVYDRSIDEEGQLLGTDDNVRTAPERVGFQFNDQSGTIEMQLSENTPWQTLTDPAVLKVTEFTIRLNARLLPCPGATCPTGPGGCPLRQTSRDLTLVIVAQAVHDASVRRSLSDTIRLRNDTLREVCPAAAGT